MSKQKKNWASVPLAEIGQWVGGGTPSKSNPQFWTEKGIPWVSPKDMKSDSISDAQDHITQKALDNSSTNLIESGSVLVVARSGILQHTLPVAVTTSRVALNQDIKAVKPREGISPEYLRLSLKAFEQTILQTCTKTGTTVQSIEMPVFLRFEVPVAPPEEQRQIVAEIEKQFTRLDAGVAALRRVQANLKRYRAAILKAACEGRLVPTEAELAKKQPSKRGSIPRKGAIRDFEPGAMLLERILTERRKLHEQEQERAPRKKKYKEPTAPTIPSDETLPDGWAWATWDQIGFSQNGRPFPSANYQETGFKLLRPGSLHVSGKVIWTENNTRCLPQRFADENSDLVVTGGELVMNLTAQSLKDEFLGRVCITGDGDQCLLNQRLARLTPVIISPQFVLVLLKAWRFRRFVDGLNSGSLIQHMFTSQLAEFTFALPPLDEQTRIVAEVDRRLSMAEELETVVNANLQRATRLRQSILQQAFAGGLAR